MTRRNLIMQSIAKIDEITTNTDKNYVDLRDSIWKKFSLKKRNELRIILFSNGFVRHHTDDTWSLQLTSEGILTKKWHLDWNGNIWFFRSKNFRNFIITLIVASLSAIISSVLTTSLDYNRKSPPTISNKSVVIQQTIYLQHTKKSDKDSLNSTGKK